MLPKATVSFWTRLRYRALIHLLCFFMGIARFLPTHSKRRIGLLPETQSLKPTLKTSISSSVDPGRQIALHIYYPTKGDSDDSLKPKLPLPVHISFHGSGFCLPIFGSDAEKCMRQATELGCIVIDADYAKTTSYTYPACIEDGLDVLAYVKSHPEIYDASRITVGGYSSGVYIALEMVLRAQPGDIKSVISWYGVIDLSVPYDERPSKRPKKDLPPSMLPPDALHMFVDALIPDGADLLDPMVNPAVAPSASYPPMVLIVGEMDILACDSIELSERLKADGVDCELVVLEGADHAFDTRREKDLQEKRKKAIEVADSRLRAVYSRT